MDAWGHFCSNFTMVREMHMSVGMLFKIAAVGILVTLLNQILKHSGKEDLAYIVSLGGFIMCITWILPYIVDLFQTIETMFNF